MAATIRDVAQASGVHVSTVSRTFSAPHLVNPETRNRVLAVAEDLGYRPNRAARALTTGRTHNLGLIVADISNPFFPPLIKAAQAHARTRDYHVFVADTDEDPQVEEELIKALAKQVDGVLLCSPRLSNRAIERLHADVPFVVVNREVKGMPTVLMDIGQGARLAIEHLAGLGHLRVALVSGPSGSWTSKRMREAAAAVDGVDLVFLGPNTPTEQGGLAAAAEVAASGATGVLAYNDLVAMGLIEGLHERGVQVPGDVSVVGVDDIVAGRLNRPKLTTVAMPTAAAGRMAVDLLLQSVAEGGTATLATLATGLVVRESTGPAPEPAAS
ncbi:LacI family transcriptional regulator [Planomonospora parontospora subsp. parontospora]|uniref:LacI family transcriptional regulator n=2 Tax=Planomonospora parontospora TaxID=58119 RepID=A0AA37F3F9_9ACTN|nr:LacI family DNA-binding transcriptional regulator [Planomonospora parontospora]GGK57607.1 LacI family transcriptional regulator [Planomonospora parontospora]GII07788.1 LacI family transcriptional regulator [Planomonospora parontospora subsp. parontospora]